LPEQVSVLHKSWLFNNSLLSILIENMLRAYQRRSMFLLI
jgi:hypothetical protein